MIWKDGGDFIVFSFYLPVLIVVLSLKKYVFDYSKRHPTKTCAVNVLIFEFFNYFFSGEYIHSFSKKNCITDLSHFQDLVSILFLCCSLTFWLLLAVSLVTPLFIFNFGIDLPDHLMLKTLYVYNTKCKVWMMPLYSSAYKQNVGVLTGTSISTLTYSTSR